MVKHEMKRLLRLAGAPAKKKGDSETYDRLWATIRPVQEYVSSMAVSEEAVLLQSS
jgi:hypothetical protein